MKQLKSAHECCVKGEVGLSAFRAAVLYPLQAWGSSTYVWLPPVGFHLLFVNDTSPWLGRQTNPQWCGVAVQWCSQGLIMWHIPWVRSKGRGSCRGSCACNCSSDQEAAAVCPSPAQLLLLTSSSSAKAKQHPR